jgi:hypothetical protein
MRTRIVATVWVAALSAMVLGALPAAAEENDEPYFETTLILELQAPIRADDKGWFMSHIHYPVRYFGKTKHHHPLEGLVLEPLRRDHQP